MAGRRKSKLRPVRQALRRMALGLLPRALSLFGRMSVRSADRFGRTLGRAAFLLLPRLRAQTLDHIGIAFGDRRGAAERTSIGRRSFEGFAAAMCEWLVLCRFGPDRAAGAVRRVEGWDHMERARSAGRGVVIVTAHFGLFELMPVYVIRRGLPGKVVGRQHDDRGLDSLLTEIRRSMGVETVFQHQAREMFRVLRGGGGLGVLPDQDIDKLSGIFVPFFGREAYTPSGPAALAVTTGAPIVPAFLYRDGPGRHRLVVRPPIDDPGGDRDARVRALTIGWCRVFEAEIEAAPEQWAWVHKRWDTTPEDLVRRRARRAKREGRREGEAREGAP